MPQHSNIADRKYRIMANAASSETCRKCAECCRHNSFVELSQHDVNVLEEFTGLHFAEFTNPKGEAVEGYFLKFNENGDCIFLNGDSGHYSCSVYEARAEVCRDYPSRPTQNEVCDANRKMCLSGHAG